MRRFSFPEPFVVEVLSKNDIVDIVSQYVKIERRGKDYFGLCPFHSEKTPSFSVVPAKQIYYCFGCNKGGNVINFIKDIENLEYGEAIKYLADKSNIPIPEQNSYIDEKRLALEKRIYKMNSIAARYFFDNMKTSKATLVKSYLESRKINMDSVLNYGIGCAVDSWSGLVDHLSSLGYSKNDMLDAGLASKTKNGIIDRFRNRLMFPIIDMRNRVIGFGGRALKEGDIKYINSPETLVYKKNQSLYGLHKAKLTKEDDVIIVEGYMDCISLYQAGFHNVIASLGTALTENQARLIKRVFGSAIIAYDNDAAGRAASIRGLDILAKSGCTVKVMIIPKQDSFGNQIKDPDDFIKQMGVKAFRQAMQESLMLVEYKALIYSMAVNMQSSEGQISFLKNIAAAIRQVDSPVEQEVYIKNIARQHKIQQDALRNEVNAVKGQSVQNIDPHALSSSVHSAVSVKNRDFEQKLDFLIYGILVLLCNNSEFLGQVKNHLVKPEIEMESSSYDLLLEIIEKYDQKEYADEAKIASMMDDEQRAVFMRQAAEYSTISDPRKALNDYLNKYAHDTIVSNIKYLTSYLLDDNNSTEETQMLKEKIRGYTSLLSKYKQ